MSELPSRRDDLKIVAKRYYGRWLSALLVLLGVVAIAHSMMNNPRFEWGVIAENFTGPSILQGGLGRMLGRLFLWYNIAALYPTVSLALPGLGEVWSTPSNALISPFSAAVIALVMHQSAYAAEIVRAGIQSVGRGQLEAARALGYRPAQILRHTILPQAMRAIMPPAGNEIIGQLKTTAVVSVISLQDVLFSAQIIYQRTYEVIPLLLVATLWYLLMTSVLSVGQFYVERYFGRGVTRREKRSLLPSLPRLSGTRTARSVSNG